MRQIVNDTIANLAEAERYKVARPYADRILRMFAITLLAGENTVPVAISAIHNWYWRAQTVGVPQIELNTVCAQLVEITAAIRKDCGKKAEQAYREADDAN